LFGQSCYFFSREKIGSFDSALSECQERDGYLVEIESKVEDTFIVEEVTVLNDGNFELKTISVLSARILPLALRRIGGKSKNDPSGSVPSTPRNCSSPIVRGPKS
jgi:hypothetical protein